MYRQILIQFWQKIVCYWAKFHCCKWPNLKTLLICLLTKIENCKPILTPIITTVDKATLVKQHIIGTPEIFTWVPTLGCLFLALAMSRKELLYLGSQVVSIFTETPTT